MMNITVSPMRARTNGTFPNACWHARSPGQGENAARQAE